MRSNPCYLLKSSLLYHLKKISSQANIEAAAICPNQILNRIFFLCHNKPKNHLPSLNTWRFSFIVSELVAGSDDLYNLLYLKLNNAYYVIKSGVFPLRSRKHGEDQSSCPHTFRRPWLNASIHFKILMMIFQLISK